ncbi:hypothetical protein VTI74DRAFT_2116 [Chaetomium olivicolor]
MLSSALPCLLPLTMLLPLEISWRNAAFPLAATAPTGTPIVAPGCALSSIMEGASASRLAGVREERQPEQPCDQWVMEAGGPRGSPPATAACI